jgi:acid phosphatase (class A)
MLRNFLFVAVSLVLVACGSKYPYPPNFVAPEQISMRTLPVPPAPHSQEWDEDVTYILSLQENLSPETIAQIKAEKPVVPEMLATASLGDSFNATNYPATFEFLKRTGSDAWRISDMTKDYWGTTRPYLMDKRITLHAERITSHAYPSGHTTTNFVWAELLSELMPQAREAFFARATEVAYHRVKGGVHYPHDVEGGQMLAREIVAKMKASPDFWTSFKAAQTELKQKPVRYKKSCCKKGHCPKKR